MKKYSTKETDNTVDTGLWTLLDSVPDPRNPSGKRHSLGNILRLMLSGFLCGCNCTAEVLRWFKRLPNHYQIVLGFPDKVISAGALSNLFAKIDMASLEQTLNRQTFDLAKDTPNLLQYCNRWKNNKR